MDETTWNTCTDPQRMLEYLRGRISERKLRLFAVACHRCVWEQLPEDELRIATEVAERQADGQASIEELYQAYSAAWIEPDYVADAFADALTTPECIARHVLFDREILNIPVLSGRGKQAKGADIYDNASHPSRS